MGRDGVVTDEEARRASSRFSPSTLALLMVLLAAAVGAVSLVRQRAIVPPPPPPEPAWAGAGHDAAHTSHSLSLPVGRDITWRWGRPIAIAPVTRAPVVDGNGGVYLARGDGALLSLAANGTTNWCAAVQPVTDTACAGPVPGAAPPLPVAVNALIRTERRVDVRLYAVDGRGGLSAFDPASSTPLWRVTPHPPLVTDAGLVSGLDGITLYGVAALPGPASTYAVVALGGHGSSIAAWRSTPIRSRGLTAVSVAPDGSVLVAARSPVVGADATLYALDVHGAVRWRLPLAPGLPSYVSVAGTPGDWVAWCAVAGAARSVVVVADRSGAVLWRWSVGHPLDVTGGGVALAHPKNAAPARDGLGYVGSAVGVYALDLRRRHSWLFFDTRALGAGAAGPPTTDARDTVYLATDRGHIYDVRADGTTLWHYDSGRDARGPLVLDPAGAVLVVGHDAAGNSVVEELGAGGTPIILPTAAPTLPPTPAAPGTGTTVATGTVPVAMAATSIPLACAPFDCPTATPTVTGTTTTGTITPTVLPAVPPTVPATLPLTATPTATG